MTERSTRRSLFLLVLLVFGLCVLLFLAIRYFRTPADVRLEDHAPVTPRADSSAVSGAASPAPVVTSAPDTLPVRRSIRRTTPALPPIEPVRPDTLRSDLAVYEFMRDFYEDVKVRTVTVALADSRLDSTGPLRWAFTRSVTGDDRSPVLRFLVSVDSVSPLRKYIFPGWGYGSDWVPLPDGSIGLECGIEPKTGVYRLVPTGKRDLASGSGEMKNDRLNVRLRSPTGYSYVVRFGVEFAGGATRGGSRPVYTRAERVEFPQFVRCGSLGREAADTVYVATTDPAAIHEVAATIPNLPVVAVLLQADPDAEWTASDLTVRKDVTIFMNTTTVSGESFVILSGSRALVERRFPDPAFDRIVRSHLGSGMHAGTLIEDDPARPVLRRTDLLVGPEPVTALRSLFRRYVRESGRQM